MGSSCEMQFYLYFVKWNTFFEFNELKDID